MLVSKCVGVCDLRNKYRPTSNGAVAQVPIIVTDFCEEAAIRARCVLQHVGGDPTPVSVNPFRSPLRLVASDNNLPSYANGFLFTHGSLAHEERVQQ